MTVPSARRSSIKLLLVGDIKTGKQCYVTRLVHNKYPADAWSNKDCNISSTDITIDDTTKIPVQIYNIHGCERGKTKIKKYFKDIHGYMIMFDVTAPETYDNVIGWKNNIVDENKAKKLPCVLLANKCDLQKDEEINAQMEGLNNYCEALGFSAYFETSSKNNTAVKQSCEHLLREILRQPSSLLSNPCTRQEYTIKIIVIGDMVTGKNALIKRYVKNTFPELRPVHNGVDLNFKQVLYQDNLLRIHIWHINSDERYGNLTHLYYKDTVACLIVFDVSRSKTLNDGALKWKENFDAKFVSDYKNQVPCVLVGNKCDLPKDQALMNDDDLRELCRKHNFSRYFETSAKKNINIEQVFQFLISQAMDRVVFKQHPRA